MTSGFPAAGRSRGVPVEYPDGCEVFIVYISDPTHNWEKAGLLKHQNVWKAETEEGKKGIETHIEKRKAGKV